MLGFNRNQITLLLDIADEIPDRFKTIRGASEKTCKTLIAVIAIS